ncbi:MAG: AAA family ATPase [Bacteriovoracaceae bacterium]|nr:AAA family ATPase [Bacteriovoracaceae bacterium]
MKNNSVPRTLNLNELLQKKSHFLLGPRQTGKSTMIKDQLSKYKKYNLLDLNDFRKLSFRPTSIREELTPRDKIIIINGIQKIPELLNEVQLMIEDFGIKFLLTGSSARKLKRYGTNLLGGRARMINFHPFTFQELNDQFDLSRVLNYGLIPSIYFSDDPEQDLKSYIGLYLQQEVANESLTRNLTNFTRFLEVISLCQAEQLNLTNLSNDAQVPRTTIHDYLEILKDTLIADVLPVWQESKKRKPVSNPKFYFFDWGVARQLAGIGHVKLGSPLAGKAFESYLYQEFQAATDYYSLAPLCYWRSQDKSEVDFIFNNETAIEVKSSSLVHASDLKNLLKLKEEKKLKRYVLLYTGSTPKKLEGFKDIEILPYQDFLQGINESK